MLAKLFASSVMLAASAALAAPLTPGDLIGTWRMSAVKTAKYGCDIPGAMTVRFKPDGNGGLTGVYSIPSGTESFSQAFLPVATMGTVLRERDAAGRAITLDAPGALRRIMAVETAAGQDGRPARLEWSSTFGGFGEETSIWDTVEPSAWLTRCPN